MKLLMLILAISIMGCSKQSSKDSRVIDLTNSCETSPEYIGDWESANGNTLSLNEDCSGSVNYCAMQFEYNAPDGGMFMLDVIKVTEDEYCPQKGDNICNIFKGTDAFGEYIAMTCSDAYTIYYK